MILVLLCNGEFTLKIIWRILKGVQLNVKNKLAKYGVNICMFISSVAKRGSDGEISYMNELVQWLYHFIKMCQVSVTSCSL